MQQPRDVTVPCGAKNFDVFTCQLVYSEQVISPHLWRIDDKPLSIVELLSSGSYNYDANAGILSVQSVMLAQNNTHFQCQYVFPVVLRNGSLFPCQVQSRTGVLYVEYSNLEFQVTPYYNYESSRIFKVSTEVYSNWPVLVSIQCESSDRVYQWYDIICRVIIRFH